MCWALMTRPDQGVDLLQMIVSHRSADNFPKKFIKRFVSERVNIQKDGNVELIRVLYGSEDYLLQFKECDVVLLPYKADVFGSTMSLVFIEAMATGEIPIVSDGAVMAKELRKFNLGDLVLDFADEFSWTLVNEIKENIGIRERLNLMAECYIREHGTFAYAEYLYKNLKQRNQKNSVN